MHGNSAYQALAPYGKGMVVVSTILDDQYSVASLASAPAVALDDVSDTGELCTELNGLLQTARQLITKAQAQSTRRSYGRWWHHFVTWCREIRAPHLPTSNEVVTLYVTDMVRQGKYKAATLEIVLAAINHEQRRSKFPPISMKDEPLRSVWRGTKNTIGKRQDGRTPLMLSHLFRIIGTLPHSRIGMRDKALLLTGWAAALRRSELAALHVDDIEFVPEGMRITVRRSKTDQAGRGYVIGVKNAKEHLDLCPVAALRNWLAEGEIYAGPLFRRVDRHGNVGSFPLDDGSIARIVKRSCQAAGIDPIRFAGHSLRSGFATQAAKGKAPIWKIQEVTRHHDLNVLRRYIRDGQMFDDHAGDYLGL